MFWGVTILPCRRYTQTVEMSYHISKAVLETDLTKSPQKKRAQVMVEHDKNKYLLCNLDSEKTVQTDLDLIFTEGEEVTFYLNGDGTVHLTGYILDFQSDEMDSYDEDDEDEELVAQALKRKSSQIAPFSNAKKTKQENGFDKDAGDDDDDDDDNDDDDDEEDDDDDDDDDDDVLGMMDMEDEEDDEEDEEEDEEDDEDSVPKPSFKKPEGQKINGQMKNQNKSMNESLKQLNQQQKQNQPPKPKDGQQPSPGTKQSGMPKDQNQNSGQKKQQNQKQGGQQFNKSNQSFTKQKGPFTPGNKNEWKQVNGGVKIKDLHLGSGPATQKGKFVHLRYVGKLPDSKVFDRTGDKPFSFKLGTGEVVKGLEIGVEGMKVGGKRTIIIPPNMGYGKRKMGPIPSNSTLNFEIELVAVT